MDDFIKAMFAITLVFVALSLTVGFVSTLKTYSPEAYERCLRVFSEEYQGNDQATYHCAFITGYTPSSN